jgi:hypothetical protein
VTDDDLDDYDDDDDDDEYDETKVTYSLRVRPLLPPVKSAGCAPDLTQEI